MRGYATEIPNVPQSNVHSLQKLCPQQGWGHVSATAHHTQQGSSSASASQLSLPWDSKQHSMLSKILHAFAFWLQINLATTGLRTWTWKFCVCMGLSWCPCWSPAGSLPSWYFESMMMDLSIPTHLLAVAEVSKKRFAYEVWFISWREETVLFFGNGLVPIHCVTSHCYVIRCAKYSGLPPITADTLRLAASLAFSCLKTSSICPLLAVNGS